MKTFLIQQTHKILITAVEEPLYTIPCAQIIVRNPTIATNYLNVEQLRTVARLCATENLQDLAEEIAGLADHVVERKQSLLEMSTKSEAEMNDLLLREMEAQKPKGCQTSAILPIYDKAAYITLSF